MYGYHVSNISTAPHMDIQSEINFLLTSHFSNLTIVHVSGHQDTKKTTKLTWLELLNVRANKLARIARTTLSPLSTIYKLVYFPRSNIQLYINDVPIH